MAQPFHSSVAAPVSGGTLHVAVAGAPPGTPGVPVVIAAHGITGSHVTWAPVARHLGDAVTLLAPDLRGRGQSGSLDGPYGMAAHAADLVAVLDHVGCERAVVAGHSMGGYIVTRFAADTPERIAAGVLVDGGLPLPVPPDVDPDVLLALVLGPSLARLEKTFPSVEVYRDYWRAHPAFSSNVWSDDVGTFVDYDLAPPGVGPDGETVYRSRVSLDAVRADGRDLLDAGSTGKALQALPDPSALLWAPRGIQNEERPLLPAEVIADAQTLLPHLVVTEVPETNHYFVLLGDRPSGSVAAEIRRLASLASS